MKAWQRLKLYQKGVIVGFFIPIIIMLLLLTVVKAFEYFNVHSYIPDGPLMFLSIMYLLGGKVWISCLLWGLIGGFIGYVLEVCKINAFIFRMAKYTIGLVLVIFAMSFFIYSLDGYVYMCRLVSLIYPLIMLMITLLFVILGH